MSERSIDRPVPDTAAPRFQRVRYLRPLYLAILLSMFGELAIWVVWGLILFPGSNLLTKLS